MSLKLHRSASRGEIAQLLACLQHGEPVDSRDASNWTPLHYASVNGRVEVAALLLGKAAAVDAMDSSGRNPLILASYNGRQDMVQVLLKKGADPNLQDKDGDTALTVACKEGCKEVVRLLLEAKADANMKDKNGDTALTLASKEGHGDIVELLLEANANINMKNNEGYTGLILACKHGRKEVVGVLLGANVDVNMKNKYDDTALLQACIIGNGEIVRLLLKANADISVKNKLGKTALDVSRGTVKEMIKAAALERRDHHVDTSYPNIHFYSQPFVAEVTSVGQTVAFDDVGLITTVPPAAVPEGTQLDLTVRPCVTGPFSLPEGYQPVSPVYMITASTQLTREVKVSVEHFAELQHEEDCKNLVFLRASSTYSNHQYKFEEIPREKFTFLVGNRRGVVSLKHFSFLQAVRMKGIIGALFGEKNAYSLRLYRSPNPSPKEVTALLCITLMQQLYIKNLETEVRSRFPSFHEVTVEEPVYLRKERVVVDIPSKITGWSVDCDRSPEVTRCQLDLPLLNPDYTQFSSYPPKFCLRVLPAAMEGNQIQATSCRFSINGLQEAAQFTLFLPVTHTNRTSVCTSEMLPEANVEEDGDTDAPLGEEHLKFLLKMLKVAAAKWREVGVYLGFRSGVLDIIQATPMLCVEGPHGFFRDLLTQWLKWAPPDHTYPTVGNLVSALRRAGEERMALEFEDAFKKRQFSERSLSLEPAREPPMGQGDTGYSGCCKCTVI